MNNVVTPYEYYNDVLGVQARFIFDSDNSHEKSIRLIGERGLQKRIENNRLKKIRATAPGMPMLISWQSCPETWQNLLIKAFGEPKAQIRKSIFEQHYTRDSKAFDFYSVYRFDDGLPLDDNKVEEYTLNASVLNTMLTLYDKRKTFIKALKGETNSIWSIIQREVSNFRHIQHHTLPEAQENLQKEAAKYRKSGYSAIISKKHRNSNARKVTPELELFLNSLFADFTYKPNKEEIARTYEGFLNGYIEILNNNTGELYKPSDFPRLSISTITTYLAKWYNAIATEGIRSGDRQKYMKKYKPYHSLERPKFAGSIISIDDRQPAFEYEKGRRMWFYNGIDLASEAFTVWVYGKSKEGIIKEFYRQMVRNYAEWGFNLPAELEAELSLNASYKDTFLQEGSMFQYVRIEANNARGKRIEAYYKPLRYAYEKKREGWLARPFALSEANQAGPKEAPIIPYKEIIQGCLRDIETWNNTEHSTIKGKTRWQVFVENQNPNLRPTNYRAILPYLGEVTKSSCHAGIIKLQNKEFLLGNNGLIAVGELLIQLMSEVEGRELKLYWLDRNNGEVLKAFVYIGETFICEAIEKPTYQRARIERTPQDEANRELMSKYVATIEGYGRRRRKEIDKITIIDNTPRTLNNEFKISNIDRYIPKQETAEVLPGLSSFDDTFFETVEVERPSKRKLIDRFNNN